MQEEFNSVMHLALLGWGITLFLKEWTEQSFYGSGPKAFLTLNSWTEKLPGVQMPHFQHGMSKDVQATREQVPSLCIIFLASPLRFFCYCFKETKSTYIPIVSWTTPVLQLKGILAILEKNIWFIWTITETLVQTHISDLSTE